MVHTMNLHKTYYIKDNPNVAFFSYAKKHWADFYTASPIQIAKADYEYYVNRENKLNNSEIIPLCC